MTTASGNGDDVAHVLAGLDLRDLVADAQRPRSLGDFLVDIAGSYRSASKLMFQTGLLLNQFAREHGVGAIRRAVIDGRFPFSQATASKLRKVAARMARLSTSKLSAIPPSLETAYTLARVDDLDGRIADGSVTPKTKLREARRLLFEERERDRKESAPFIEAKLRPLRAKIQRAEEIGLTRDLRDLCGRLKGKLLHLIDEHPSDAPVTRELVDAIEETIQELAGFAQNLAARRVIDEIQAGGGDGS